jgi:alpha-L-fucosidase
MDRRKFIRSSSLLGLGLSSTGLSAIPTRITDKIHIPPHLSEYQDLYIQNPKKASLEWFRDARFGLFMHYGLYSQLGRGEWVMYHENIPIKEYETLKNTFTARNFNADQVTDMAMEAGMKYINITARHHDSFCLFDSDISEYNSMQSPAKRDLVGELAEQCHAKRMGLFLYYSYALDWRHPYFYPRHYFAIARPDYPNPEKVYKFRDDDDFLIYIDFVHGQLKELLTNYGPLAGIWFDPIMGYYARPQLFPVEETYTMIRKHQPHALISFKQGATGTEDFAAPERHGQSLEERVLNRIGPKEAEIAAKAWASNKSRHNEICDTMQPGAWGYRKADDGKHATPDEVLRKLEEAASRNCNLLLNTGPLPDGDIDPTDRLSLSEVGKHIRKQGWPGMKSNVPN